jgi:beta-glucanase (GH16 family)
MNDLQPDPAQWTLVWSDEFEGDAVDRTKWDFDLGNGFYDYRNHAWIPGWGNEELQYYTGEPENVVVQDSCLRIRAVKSALHGCGYTSARLRSKARDGRVLFAKQYGRIAFRARVPWGKGLWPALWMLPVDDAYGGWAASGEIDLMEIVGERPEQVLSSLHFGSAAPRRTLITATHPLPPGQLVSDWHTYAVEWEPGEIRFYVDEVLTCRYDHWWSCGLTDNGQGLEAASEADLHPWPAPFDQPFYLVMNVAVGGNFPGKPNAETHFPAELVVDWVRVWDKVGGYGPATPRGPGVMPWEPGHEPERRAAPVAGALRPAQGN